MEALKIKGDLKTPKVEFNPDGRMLLEGRAIPERPDHLFLPIFEWIDNAELDTVDFTVRLEYFNTTVSKHIAMMFKKMVENPKIGNITVNWFYEEGDDDCHESGLFYKDKFEEINFEFFVFQ
jgi:hypothetical protein